MYASTAPSSSNNTLAISPEDPAECFYIHSRRKEWGFAILAWERGSKRGYQFEDGTLRIFREGFYRLFETVSPPEDRAEELREELELRLARSLQRKNDRSTQSTKSAKKPKQPPRAPWSFDDQIKVFRHLYSGGFQDPTWLEDIRGEGEHRRRLKRHRQPAIDAAQRDFTDERLGEMINAGQLEEVRDLAVAHLKSVDLVSRAQLKPLLEMKEASLGDFAQALRDLLHGAQDDRERVDRFCASMQQKGGKLSWQLATALLTLYHPTRHFCVRPSTLQKQLPEVAPGAMISTQPDGSIYKQLLTVAEQVRDRLTAVGLSPKDMLDVHDFCVMTLRPSAEKTLKEAQQEA